MGNPIILVVVYYQSRWNNFKVQSGGALLCGAINLLQAKARIRARNPEWLPENSISTVINGYSKPIVPKLASFLFDVVYVSKYSLFIN